jgi:hypothetical protein
MGGDATGGGDADRHEDDGGPESGDDGRADDPPAMTGGRPTVILLAGLRTPDGPTRVPPASGTLRPYTS